MKSSEKLEVVQKKLGEITPYANNPRNNDDAVEAVAASIREFGFQQPIVTDKDGVIIVGHTRLKAAEMLGLETVPVVVADLDEDKANAYRLADNKTGEIATWDFELLDLELEGIEMDMEQFGFEIDEPEPVEITEDDFTEDVETRCKLGDLWQLGKHRLICGDSTNVSVVDRLMDGEKADMVFTDPPWNVDYGGGIKEDNPQNYKPRKILNDSMSTEAFKGFMDSSFACMNNASKDGAMTYVVMSPQEWGNMMLSMYESGYHWSSTIIWVKNSLVLSRKDYHTQYEPIWYGWKNGSRLYPLKDRKQSDVWEIERPARSDEHPTMKPVPLVARAISNSSNSGDIVLDLFGGSGTTIVACEQLNRKCYMSELDPHYCDVIINRWEQLTGEKAELITA